MSSVNIVPRQILFFLLSRVNKISTSTDITDGQLPKPFWSCSNIGNYLYFIIKFITMAMNLDLFWHLLHIIKYTNTQWSIISYTKGTIRVKQWCQMARDDEISKRKKEGKIWHDSRITESGNEEGKTEVYINTHLQEVRQRTNKRNWDSPRLCSET